MKRIFALILVSAVVFGFAGCGKKSPDKKKLGLDVEYYASLGKMPECTYALGESVDKITDELSSKAKEDSFGGEGSIGTYFDTYEQGDRTVMIATNFTYYYTTKEKDGGISTIATFGTAYGYETGTVSSEIQKELTDSGFKAETRDISDEEAFFMPAGEKHTCLEYTFKDYKVIFVFFDNYLCATAITKK